MINQYLQPRGPGLAGDADRQHSFSLVGAIDIEIDSPVAGPSLRIIPISRRKAAANLVNQIGRDVVFQTVLAGLVAETETGRCPVRQPDLPEPGGVIRGSEHQGPQIQSLTHAHSDVVL